MYQTICRYIFFLRAHHHSEQNQWFCFGYFFSIFSLSFEKKSRPFEVFFPGIMCWIMRSAWWIRSIGIDCALCACMEPILHSKFCTLHSSKQWQAFCFYFCLLSFLRLRSGWNLCEVKWNWWFIKNFYFSPFLRFRLASGTWNLKMRAFLITDTSFTSFSTLAGTFFQPEREKKVW